jgi:hypothetical protein
MRMLAVPVVVVAVLTLAACGSDATLPPATAAPAQHATLGWVEPTAKSGPRLVFEVREMDVLRDGWRAQVAITNDSEITWSFGSDRSAAALNFGVMLFATGDLDEVTQRDRNRDLPGLRRAHEVSPLPPPRLAPGEVWTGTIAAPGSLAAGRWLRVVFGPISAEGDTPAGLPGQVVWITDNAHRLRD